MGCQRQGGDRVHRLWIIVLAGAAMLTAMAGAQTAVTNNNDGVAYTVPMYTSSSVLGNSPITFVTPSGCAANCVVQLPEYVDVETTGLPGRPGVNLPSDGSIMWPGNFFINGNSSGIQFYTAPGYTLSLSNIGWLTNEINTTATASLNYSGPKFITQGTYWNGSASATDYWAMENVIGSGANPTSTLNFTHSGTSGQANISLPGYVGIGTTTPGAALEVDGNVKLTAGSGASITFQDGSVQTTAYIGSTCNGGDWAESVDVTGDRTKYAPGDVLVIDPDHPGRFLKSVEPYSTSVTGIYSTKPGTIGRRQLTPKSPDEVPMAIVGIVPTKVSAENGPIHPGDLLVSSSKVGYAMKGTDRSRMLGAVVGKAIGSLDSGTGVIEVVVTLQ